MVDNVRLPTTVEEGAVGGPRCSVIVHEAASGLEHRVDEWDVLRHEWDISYGIRSESDLATVKAFYLARGGKFRAFRFKDWNDYTLTTQLIGTGDGAEDAFQIVKTYTDGVQTYTRTIQLPVSGTLSVTVNAVAKVETTDYTVNYSTGVITFGGGDIPGSGHAVRVTGEFDVPVRFDDDLLKITAIAPSQGRVPSISIIEVLGE